MEQVKIKQGDRVRLRADGHKKGTVKRVEPKSHVSSLPIGLHGDWIVVQWDGDVHVDVKAESELEVINLEQGGDTLC